MTGLTKRAGFAGLLLALAACWPLCLSAQRISNETLAPGSAGSQGKVQTPVAGSPPASPAASPPSTLRDAGKRKRDPFQPMLGREEEGAAEHLPPGKAGLVISKLRVLGVSTSPNGMIAVVSNAQGRVYFLRDGDRLHDGRVGRITLGGVAFFENTKDALGRPVEVAVTKRPEGTPGAQQ